jgi:hypothetical protein
MVFDLQDRTAWNTVISSWGLPNNSIIHNLYIKGNYAHISYYTSGYIVLDISNPTNPVLAGQYDTYPQNNSGNYAGAWGVFPFFPSGAVVVSDMQTGLYIFNFLLDPIVPVELVSFNANIIPEGVQLNWETATEINNLGFEIERKLPGKERNFIIIGFSNGAGTTTSPKQYTFLDDKIPAAGNYTYRLKQVDTDGSFIYSEEIQIDFAAPNDFILKQNYPNPFNPSTTIEFVLGQASFVKLDVYNALGEKVANLLNENKEQGSYQINFDAVNLPSGIYIAKLEAENKVQTIKMSLLK